MPGRAQTAKAIDVKCPRCGSGPRTACEGKRVMCNARRALARKVTGILVEHFTLVEEPCPGEAHKNPFIDHCMVCAPRWGTVERLHPKEF